MMITASLRSRVDVSMATMRIDAVVLWVDDRLEQVPRFGRERLSRCP